MRDYRNRNPVYGEVPDVWKHWAEKVLRKWSELTAEQAEEKLSWNLFEIFKEKFPDKFPLVAEKEKPPPAPVQPKLSENIDEGKHKKKKFQKLKNENQPGLF